RFAVVPCRFPRARMLRTHVVMLDLPGFFGRNFFDRMRVPLLHNGAGVQVRTDPIDIINIAEGINGEAIAVALDRGILFDAGRAGLWRGNGVWIDPPNKDSKTAD